MKRLNKFLGEIKQGLTLNKTTEKLDFMELLKEASTLEALAEAGKVLRIISIGLERAKAADSGDPGDPLELTKDQQAMISAAMLIAYGRKFKKKK